MPRDTPLSILMSPPRSDDVLTPRQEAVVIETHWEVLERFGQRLIRTHLPEEQFHLALAALQECLGADALFWRQEETGTDVLDGTVDLHPDWRRDFIAWLQQSAGGQRQVLRSFLDPAAKPMSPWPCSVVLVQMVPGQQSWLAALSFHPRRLFSTLDLKVIMLARRIWLNLHQKEPVDEKLKEALFGLVHCLSTTLEAKDRHTHGHSERVARIARRLGEQMGLPPVFVRDLFLAGLLHDIGKVGTREEVLRKPASLTDEEREHLRQHPIVGDRVLAQLKPLHSLRPGVRGHHEHYDGTGYPDRLRGQEIPLAARILAVADALDAMLSDRPYRPALPLKQVRLTLMEGAGKQWDPLVIEHLIAGEAELVALTQAARGPALV